MKENKFSEDKILLKLYRQYGKDEALKYLFDEISRLKFQVGELKSEVAELKHMQDQPETKGITYDENMTELIKEKKTKAKNYTRLKKEVTEWRNKYFNIIAQTQN